MPAPKKEEVRQALPEELQPVFDQLAEEYRAHSLVHYGRPFVSYIILAELVRAGWRPSAESLEQQQEE